MEVNGIDDLMEKIEQLRESLRMSDELLPLVTDMFKFIKDIIPLMLEVNAFMRDGTKKLPSASNNLHLVSKTTEMATNEIMDQLEDIIQKLSLLKKDAAEKNDPDKNLLKIDEIQNKVSEIFLAFQFQDITTQQLEYVNRILKAIYTKFIDLFNSSLKLRANTILGQDVILAIEKELEQGEKNESDVSFEESTTDFVRQNGVSQALIDKYFKKDE